MRFDIELHATILNGVVEIDGGWFGGYIRPENHRVARIDRRRREHQNGKRLCVVVDAPTWRQDRDNRREA